jgi:hypothetical protein
MTLLNKLKNEQNRQLQIQAQLAEQSYRAFNGVKQSRENERSGELRKKMNDDLPASSLTKTMIQDYQREEEEEEDFYENKGEAYKYRPSGATEDLIDLTYLPTETNLPGLTRGAREHDLVDEEFKRDKLIKERNDKLKEIEKIKEDITALQQQKATAKRAGAIKTLNIRIQNQETEEKKVLDKIQKIDEKIYNSTSRIKQIEDNLKLNENRVIDAEQKNKQIVQKYEEGFNLANRQRYQVKQQPNETDKEYIERIQSLESMPFDRTIFEERAATKNILKLQNNLKELVRNEIIIGEIVRHYSTAPEAVFLINSNWKKMLPILLQMTGYNNKTMTPDQFANTIDYVISILADPQPRINITNITPPGALTTPAGAPTTPPSTPARGAPPGTPARGASTPAPATPAATSASTSGWWPSGWGGWGSSSSTGTLSSPSLPSSLTIQVKNDPKTIHIYNSVMKSNLFIKLGEFGRTKLRKIMYSKTTDSKGEYKAINFTNVRTTSNEHGFKNVLNSVGISLNDTTYEQVFGSDTECRIANVYTHLEKVIKDKIPSGEFFTGADGIVGYGIINDNIPKQVNFGKNIILLNKLYYKNILSVKDKNLHAVEYLPNVKVSDNFVDIIFGMTKNKQPSKETINSLSTDERHLLDTLLYICGIKSASVSSNKDDIIKELKNKLRLAEGQIKAGNDNPVVKEELKDIIKKLYLYNVVSLKNSKDYLKQF